MVKSPFSRVALTDAVWLRWALIVAGLIAWLAITQAFPLYFQRDEVQMMNWTNHHSVLDGFIPTKECGFSHDTNYRPLLYSYWWILYKTLGFNFLGFYILTGLLFIVTLAYLFKLVAKLSDNRSAYLSLLVFLSAFQFLLTVLFWVTQQGYLFMMVLTLVGLFNLVEGLGSSRLRVIYGTILMAASVLFWEPLAIISSAASAAFIAARAKSIGWTVRKAAAVSIAVAAVGPAYWLLQPYSKQRVAASGATEVTFADVASRFTYYIDYLTSGMTGLILVTPAAYLIVSRLFVRGKRESGLGIPLSLAAAVLVSAAIAKLDLSFIGLALIVAAALLLPRIAYMLLAVALIPIGGLVLFPEVSRTYLFSPAYALSGLAAIQLSGMWVDVRDWWTARITRPAVTFAVVAIAFGLALAPIAHKMKDQVGLLRLRSDVTQNVKAMTPHLKGLPKGASVVIVDYASMGVQFGRRMLTWTDREKLLYQAPVDSTKGQFWFNDIGRPDLKKVTYQEFARDSKAYLAKASVYVWLETAKDHEFFASRKLKTVQVAELKRGEATMSLLRLR
jgi:hypothetical protein